MDAKQMRRRLAAAAQEHGITSEADYDRREGWEWEWTDGPTPAAVAASLGQEAAAQIRLKRRPGPRAAALAVIAEALHGTPAEDRLESEDTTTAPDERTGALADALAAAAERHGADDTYWLRRRLGELGGPAGLLHPYTGSAAEAGDPLAMTPAEHLTERYVSDYEAREAWREHLRTAPDEPGLARAALADAEAAGPTRLAAVALLGALRAEMAALELAAMDAAVAAGASYADLGRALGVARQVAHRRHTRRAETRPTRSSPQR